jgi:formiminotetrahydrofolate cyclodeaminase
MKKYKAHTLDGYLDILSKRTPVPGGGSAAALTGALGAALISMVANYSDGKCKDKSSEKRLKYIIKKSGQIKDKMLELVDLDADAYMKVVKTKNASDALKKKALADASKVPMDLCQLCFDALELTPFLVLHGNKFLVSDVEVAIEMLFAAYNSSVINIKINNA